MASPAGVPEPEPGSVRYFVLLYTPRARRSALATLLAITDELGAGLRRQLDHGVAHARLAWWAQEAARSEAGQPLHPWLSALRAQDVVLPSLEGLVEAASRDLASATLQGQRGGELAAACFLAAARTLGHAPLAPEDAEAIQGLGRWVGSLEVAAEQERGSTPVHVPPPMPNVTLQWELTPLLVWSALARARERRRRQQPGSAATSLHALADNFIAWRAARRAARRQFRPE